MPHWPLTEGDASGCTGTDIKCGSGECIAKELFCDDAVDCADGSDENICSKCQEYYKKTGIESRVGVGGSCNVVFEKNLSFSGELDTFSV